MEVGKFKFEKLQIWQIAMDLGEEIDLLASNFLKRETYNLNSQIRRAADSITLNISEGSMGQGNPEKKKFIRSLSEVISCLFKDKRRNCLTPEEFSNHDLRSFELMNKTVAFRNKISTGHPSSINNH